MSNILEYEELTCPLCRNPLANKEYQKAVDDLEQKLQTNFQKESKSIQQEYANKLKSINSEHQEIVEMMKANHQEQLKQMQKDVSDSFNTQLGLLKGNYESLQEENQKRLDDFVNHLKESHEQEVLEKEKTISRLEKQQKDIKNQVMEDAKAKFQDKEKEYALDLKQRDIQIERLSKQIDDLQKNIEESQAELKGEAGELDLYETMIHAFPTDSFQRTKRGTVSADLIQKIKTDSGAMKMPIVFDNKATKTVSKADIEKSAKYKKVHSTNYSLIVANNLPPKIVPNGLYGEKDGVLLVHPSIVTQVTKQIRDGIIEISKYSTSQEDQKTKQSLLYEFILSNEFTSVLESISMYNEKMYNLQSKEEKDHQTLWKTRKQLSEQLLQAHNDLSSGISAIIQDVDPTPKTKKMESEK